MTIRSVRGKDNVLNCMGDNTRDGPMATHSGALERIGAGTSNNGVSRVSVLEIGGKIFQNVIYTDFVKTYLDSPVGKDVALSMFTNEIIALNDGDNVHCELSARSLVVFAIFAMLVSLPPMPILVGFYTFVIGIGMFVRARAVSVDLPRLKAMALGT